MKTRNKRTKRTKKTRRIQKGGNLYVYLKRLFEDLANGNLQPDEFFQQARDRLVEDANINAVKQIKNATDTIIRTRKKCEKAERRYETLLEKINREKEQKIESANNYGKNYDNIEEEIEEIGRILGEIVDEGDMVVVENPYLFDTGEYAERRTVLNEIINLFKGNP